MRRKLLLLVCSLALVSTGLAPAGAVSEQGPGPGGFMSDNVEWVTHLPGTEQGVSGRVVRVGDQTRFYTTGAKGLFIFDVTTPTTPKQLGFLALPHLQNEDVSVSADGSRVVIGADGGLLVPLMMGTGIHVIDTSDPANPKKVGFHADSNHTASCADPACNFVYGSSGNTYDLTNPASPLKVTPGWKDFIGSAASNVKVTLTQGAHDLSMDDAGLVSADTVPRVILDPRTDPTRPQVVATSGRLRGSMGLAYQHNSDRPDATAWQPRDPSAADYSDPALRPGELLIGNGETNLKARCDGSTNGPIATWSMRNFDQGEQMTPLEVFRPAVNGTWTDSNPAVNALGCSGHYFDERGGILAAAWFEHGVRFISVDKTNGKLAEVGWWQPVVTSAGAAYWIDDNYVMVTDYIRGVDIIKFDRGETPPAPEEAARSWLAKIDATAAEASAREQYICRLQTGK